MQARTTLLAIVLTKFFNLKDVRNCIFAKEVTMFGLFSKNSEQADKYGPDDVTTEYW